MQLSPLTDAPGVPQAHRETPAPRPGAPLATASAWPALETEWRSSPLRSLHVGMGWYDEQPGGLNRMVANLLQHLPAAGVATRGLVAGQPEVEQLAAGRVRSFARLSDPLPWRAFRAGRALNASLRELSPDVVALHFALFGLVGLGGLRSTPLVVHFHGPWAGEGVVEGGGALATRTKHWIETGVYRRGTRFIVLSEAFATVLQSDYGVARERMHIVPGGVDMARFAPTLSRAAARELVGLPQDRPVVLAVRRLAHRMGLQDLIAAFATVHRRVPDALLVIAGGGPLFHSLGAQIAEAGLQHSARLLGRVPDALLPALYRAADVSIVPSIALEGFGLTSVESLASGTPALVAPIGGLPEVVRDLDPGLILPEPGRDAIADAIASALLGTLRLPSPAACSDYARRRFDWPIVAGQVKAIYADAAA
ncbi:MAG: glycosyltransferase family 4 protein [Geminicoccaceae bacterium]